MQALGKGVQQGLGVYDKTLTMEDKLDALRQERASKDELENQIPALIDQARAMGVSEQILKNAELMASIKPASVYNTLNNAMVKAQKEPKTELTEEQLIWTDPTTQRRFRRRTDGSLAEEIKPVTEKKESVTYRDPSEKELSITPGLFKIQRKADGTVTYLDRNFQPLKSFVEEKLEQIPASNIESPDFVGVSGSSKPVYDGEGNILGYNIVTEPGKIQFVEAKKETVPKAEKLGPFPELGATKKIENSTDLLVHMGGGKWDRSKKETVKTSKEAVGYTYIKKGDKGFPANAPEWSDEVEISPTNQRTFWANGTPGEPTDATFDGKVRPITDDELAILGDDRIFHVRPKEDGSLEYLNEYYIPITELPSLAEVEDPEPEMPLFVTGKKFKEMNPGLAKSLKLADEDLFQITYNDKGRPTNAFKPEWAKEKPAGEQPTYMTKAQASQGTKTEKAFAKRMEDQDFLVKTKGKYTVEDMSKKEKAINPDAFKNESTLRKEFNLVAKNYTGAVQAYMAILEGAQLQSSQGDLMLIQAFQKMLDPTSVVRETEFANAQNTQGVLQKLGITLGKVSEGQMLSPTARAKFVDASRAYMSQVQKAFKPQRDFYVETAKRHKVSEKAIRDPFKGVQGLRPGSATVDFDGIYKAMEEDTIMGSRTGIKKDKPQSQVADKVIENVGNLIPSLDDLASGLNIPSGKNLWGMEPVQAGPIKNSGMNALFD